MLRVCRLGCLFAVLVGIATACAAAPPHRSGLTVKAFWTLNSTYVDKKHGVSFRYPSVWSKGTGWGMHPPGLFIEDGGDPRVGFGFETDQQTDPAGPYANSNLEGVGFSYEARETPTNAACRKLASDLANDDRPPRAMIVKGITYSRWESGEGGMNQYTGGPLLATWKHGVCYVFEQSISSFNGVRDDDEDPVNHPSGQYDLEQVERNLWRIMSTVHFSQ